MTTKYIFALIVFCFVSSTFSQTTINDYKYVIVPKSFNFLKSIDQYQLNSLTKFLFNKYGFTAIMEDEVFPKDLVYNGCLALRTDVEKLKGFFITKLVVVLRNCKDRKSTRLNSSHVVISYAVFCLKKKKQKASKSS